MQPHEPDTTAVQPTASAANHAVGVSAAVVLGLILLAAVALRAYGIGESGLELDEFWNAELSTGRGSVHEDLAVNRIYVPPGSTSLDGAPPWWEIGRTLGRVTHPPLFSIVLRLWREMVGDGDAAMRWLGVVCSTLSIIPLYAAVARLAGRTAGLWTAALMAAATTPIVVAQQIRPYNLLLLVQCLAIWQAVRLIQKPVTWAAAAGFGLISLACMFTHYFSAPMLGCLAILIVWRLDRRGAVRVIACVAVAAAVFLVTWGPAALSQRKVMNESAAIWLKDRAVHPPLATLSRLTEIPARLLLTPRDSSRPAAQLSIALVLAAGVMAVRRSDLRFWLTILAGTLGFVAMFDLAAGTAMLRLMRYSLPAAPAVFALIACMITGPPKWLAHSLPAAALLGCILSVPSAYERLWPEYRPLAADLDRLVSDDDIVVFVQQPTVAHRPNWAWHAGFQYATWSHYTTRKHAPKCLILAGNAPPDLVAELRNARSVWLVSQFDDDGGVGRIAGLRARRHNGYIGVGTLTEARFDGDEATKPSP